MANHCVFDHKPPLALNRLIVILFMLCAFILGTQCWAIDSAPSCDFLLNQQEFVERAQRAIAVHQTLLSEINRRYQGKNGAFNVRIAAIASRSLSGLAFASLYAQVLREATGYWTPSDAISAAYIANGLKAQDTRMSTKPSPVISQPENSQSATSHALVLNAIASIESLRHEIRTQLLPQSRLSGIYDIQIEGLLIHAALKANIASSQFNSVKSLFDQTLQQLTENSSQEDQYFAAQLMEPLLLKKVTLAELKQLQLDVKKAVSQRPKLFQINLGWIEQSLQQREFQNILVVQMALSGKSAQTVLSQLEVLKKRFEQGSGTNRATHATQAGAPSHLGHLNLLDYLFLNFAALEI